MGNTECFPRVQARQPEIPTDVCSNRGREDYLNRLGIQKRGRSSFASAARSPPKVQESLYVSEKRILDSLGGHAETMSNVSTEDGCLSCDSQEQLEVEMKCQGLEAPCLELKEQDDFRVAFLRKLSYEKVWVPAPQRLPKHQTVIIFDWDDTLLCTTYLNLQESLGNELSRGGQDYLKKIELAAKKLLETSMRLGQTFIITNAMQGWVEYSAAKYVPELLPILGQIPVISARSRYEPLYPKDVRMWKLYAFRDLQRELDLPIITNLNSIGDSNYEMEATQVMGKEFSEALVKTIKLREHPTPEELLKELDLINDKFEKIVTNARNLKIALERKTDVNK